MHQVKLSLRYGPIIVLGMLLLGCTHEDAVPPVPPLRPRACSLCA